MARTTALTMVNRLIRRHGFEDISAFGEPLDLLALDLVNQAIRDLTTERDYPWNIHSDGAFFLKGTVTGTSGASITAGSSSFTITGVSGVSADYVGYNDPQGWVVAKLLFTDATTHSTTAMQILHLAIAGGTMTGELVEFFPETVTNGSWKIFYPEVRLPDDVKKVLSVRHENQPIRLVEVPPHATFDEVFPRPHDTESDLPDVVGIGGQTKPTRVTGEVVNEGLRMMVWPIVTEDTVIWFTYKRRIADLEDTTDFIVAPTEFIDDVIDRAEALSNMTQRFNAPDLAQIQFRNSTMTAERKWVNSVLDPNRRHGLRAHDSGVRRDRTNYRDIEGL